MTVETNYAEDQYAYLTTTGRVSGEPREIEIWFGARGNTVYMLAGGGHGAHWVMNLIANPTVHVRLGEHEFNGTARLLEAGEEEQNARHMLATKYEDWSPEKPLSNWARTALPVAVDLHNNP
jgi:deazaflavin-dependent oxidoreductase (nitroreductase family)